MTAIFTCLLLMQSGRLDHVIAAVTAALIVALCKLAGLVNAAIFFSTLAGVIARRLMKNRLRETPHAVE
ncbi:MAG: hypothetical protein LBU45_08210 [Azoarcus sp.]|nr:hypothetical protein [Azoarcus sp.]